MRYRVLLISVLLALWLSPLTPAQAQTVTPRFIFASAVTMTDAGGKILRRDYYQCLLEKITVGATVYQRLRLVTVGGDWTIYQCQSYKAFTASGATYAVEGRANIFGAADTVKLVVTRTLTAAGNDFYSLQFTITDAAGKVRVSRSTGSLARCDPVTWLSYMP